MRLEIVNIARRTVLIYLLTAAAWILFSDRVLVFFVSPQTHPQLFANAQTIKGWLFVGATAVLLYLLLRRQFEQLEAETARRRQIEEDLRALLHAMPLAVIQMNAEGIVQYWNRPAEEMFGWTAEEVIGRMVPTIPPEQETEFAAQRRRIMAGESCLNLETVRRRADNTCIDVTVFGAPVRSAQGIVTGIMSIIMDITQRKEVEKKLLLQTAALNAAGNGIVITDVDGTVEWANPAFTTLTGYTPDEAIGKNPRDLLKSGQHNRLFFKEMWDTILSGNVWHGELINRRKDGALYYEEQTITPIKDSNNEITHFVAIKQDISARKQHETELQQSQELAQATIDALSAHIAVLDENGEIVAVNQSWLNFAQANNADLSRVGVGMNYLVICDAVVEEKAQQIAAGIRAVMRGDRETFALEYVCHAPHEPRWFVARVTPLASDNPEGRRVVVAHENITARRQAEEAVRRSEHHYRLLFDSNPQPMWVYDLETLNFLSVNDAAVSKYGYTRQQFLKMTIRDIRPPEDVSRLLDDVAQVRPKMQHSGEWRHLLQDGRIIDVEINSHTITFDGRAAALVVAFDVTERKQANAERAAQAQRLQQILDTVPDGVLLLDETDRVTVSNPAGRAMIRTLANIEVGDQLATINGRSLSTLLQTPENGRSHALQHQGRHYELLARAISPTGGDRVLLLRDVTEERERERYLQAQERLATVGQLAAGIAHDFNNVMAVVILYAQLLQKTADLSPKSQNYLRTIERQAQHAAEMIAQILDFSRRSLMEKTPIDLLPLLKELVRLLKNTLPENIHIELAADDDAYVVLADPTRLQQALMNTAVNARDAMPHGGKLRFGLSSVTIEPDQAPPLPDMNPGAWLCITVTDTGAGIAAEHIPRIFDPFFTTKPPGKGTGLGLAQLYGIVKQHDGSVAVDSQAGNGTTFTIYLPAFQTPESATLLANDAHDALDGTGNILLVEDNPTLRDSLAESLTNMGYHVLQAQNGLEAVALLERASNEIDLVLSDIVMPEMGGMDLFQVVRRRFPELPVLLMTGYPPDESNVVAAGASWIMKPFKSNELGKKIRALLK